MGGRRYATLSYSWGRFKDFVSCEDNFEKFKTVLSYKHFIYLFIKCNNHNMKYYSQKEPLFSPVSYICIDPASVFEGEKKRTAGIQAGISSSTMSAIGGPPIGPLIELNTPRSRARRRRRKDGSYGPLNILLLIIESALRGSNPAILSYCTMWLGRDSSMTWHLIGPMV
jgi:hypothetical protein